MTDPIDQVKATVTTLKSAATSAVDAQVTKQENWLKANLKPLIIGAVVGLILGWLAHGL